jgi:hypothetical protein
MDQIHLSPLVDQIQLTLGHISNININNMENPQPNQNNRPSTRGGFAPGEGEGEEDPETHKT